MRRIVDRLIAGVDRVICCRARAQWASVGGGGSVGPVRAGSLRALSQYSIIHKTRSNMSLAIKTQSRARFLILAPLGSTPTFPVRA